MLIVLTVISKIDSQDYVFTFDDEDEYELFVHDAGKDIDIRSISKYVINNYSEAMKQLYADKP